MTKYCKDCKHCKEIVSFYCEHPSIPMSNVYNQPISIRCSIMRDSGKWWAKEYKEIPKFCGPSAELYEPKPSRLQCFLQFFQPAPKV